VVDGAVGKVDIEEIRPSERKEDEVMFGYAGSAPVIAISFVGAGAV
jgi:hypothetical protein